MKISLGILFGAFGLFIISFLKIFIKLRPSLWVSNPANGKGNIPRSILYSFTGAMSPAKKESAYLHIPSYICGILFHIGLFISFVYFVFLVIGIELPGWLSFIFFITMLSGALSGLGLLLKRIWVGQMRRLSNPDDYISNIIVTGFQVLNILTITGINLEKYLILFGAFLLVYIPIGKLKHSFYFFITRIALGIYYGQIGTWGRNTTKI